MLTTKHKTEIIEKFKGHASDTGSVDVQIAILSEEIKKLAAHLKKHKKDNHSRRGLLSMVARRKKLLDYLRRKNPKRFNVVSKKLGLKNKSEPR